MFIAAFQNYVIYFKKFFKCFAIIFLSIAIFYTVFTLTIHIPIKNADLNNYNTFLNEMQNYIANITVDEIFTTDFLSTTLKEIFSIFELSNPGFTAGTGLTILSIIIVLGAFVYSQIDCKNAIREDVSNKDTVNNIKRVIFKTIINGALWVAFFILTYYWFYAIFILPLIILLNEALKILLSTWYIYFKKYKFTQIVNIKNCLRLMIVNFIILYAHTMLFIYMAPYINIYLLLILALSFFAYVSSIMQFTATKYFIEKRYDRELKIAKKKSRKEKAS